MMGNPAKNLSLMRRDKVARAKSRDAERSPRTQFRSLVGPFRTFFAGLALSLALAFCERFAAATVAGWFGFGNVVAEPGLSVFPAIAVPFVFAALFGRAAAVAQGVAASLILWVVMRFNPCTLVSMLCGTMLVPAFAPRIRKAADLAMAAFDVLLLQCALCGAISAACRVAVPSLATCEVWEAGALLAFHALSIPFCVSIFLPAAERITGRVSDRTLSTFATLENPLLQRLSREAPGTYGHCMSVADLASAAAETIGANALLARLGGYYHDIGKLSNPRYFMENQTLLGNPHDALPPSVSVMIIAGHVKDGVILAREAGLPLALVRIIACHHGTSAMEWFRLKALKLAGQGTAQEAPGAPSPSPDADAWPYRYAGPLPETREETIVSLADGVEAASRSLRNPAQSDLVRLVDKVCVARMADRQLVQSALSIRELETVKRSLVETLVHRLHVRAAYPPENP